MTKNEFLSTLHAELTKNNVTDAADIVNEYEQHFAFKLADGYSEEEIAAKLGNPVSLAVQFECGDKKDLYHGKRFSTVVGLCFFDLFAGIFFVLLSAWGIIMAAFSLACGAVAVCLFGGSNIYSLIPPIPYGCGFIFALSFVALAILVAVGCVYFIAFLRQLIGSFGRFNHNALAAASGRAVLPSLTINPKLTPKNNRRIRSVALISLTIFATCFVLGIIVSMISAGSFPFWHVWGWFGYKRIDWL